MEPCIRWGAHWRHLANMIEPSTRGGKVAFLSNFFDHLLLTGDPIHSVYRQPKPKRTRYCCELLSTDLRSLSHRKVSSKCRMLCV